MIIKDGEAVMVKGSVSDILEDLIIICYSIHKQLEMPKEKLVELIAKSLLAINDNDNVIMKSIDLSEQSHKDEPNDFPAEEFFKFQGCNSEEEYWEKMKKEMMTKRNTTEEQADKAISMLKKKFPFLNTVKKETTTQTTVTEDAANQFKSMFGDLLNE